MQIAIEKNTPDSHPQWGHYHHISFIVQGNKILEYGFNRSGEPIPGFGYNKDFGKIHSETDAYRKAKGLLDTSKHFDVVNIRLNKASFFKLSKPCRCCYHFLSAVGCRNVYFSTEKGFKKMKVL